MSDTPKEYTFSWNFVLMNGTKESFTNTSDTRAKADKLRAEYMAVLDEAAHYPTARKKVFKVCEAIGVRGGRIDSYFFGGVKESGV